VRGVRGQMSKSAGWDGERFSRAETEGDEVGGEENGGRGVLSGDGVGKDFEVVLDEVDEDVLASSRAGVDAGLGAAVGVEGGFGDLDDECVGFGAGQAVGEVEVAAEDDGCVGFGGGTRAEFDGELDLQVAVWGVDSGGKGDELSDG